MRGRRRMCPVTQLTINNIWFDGFDVIIPLEVIHHLPHVSKINLVNTSALNLNFKTRAHI
jgi:2-polyprenyl-3-methyl-5-hydroxy-6-metoxy-1,4-benzoquinol methylase